MKVVVEWLDGIREELKALEASIDDEEIEILLDDNKAMWLNKRLVRSMIVEKEVKKNE